MALHVASAVSYFVEEDFENHEKLRALYQVNCALDLYNYKLQFDVQYNNCYAQLGPRVFYDYSNLFY